MTITLTQVLNTLDAIVAEKGEDYVYPDEEKFPEGLGICRYSTDDGVPSCVAGHAIQRLDPDTFHLLAEYEARHGRSPGGMEAALLEVLQVFEYQLQEYIEPSALQALADAQMSQDHGEPWGQAVDNAHEGVHS